MRRWIFSILFLALSFNSFSQNLLGERIRRISGTKKSVYFDSGIFHNGGPKRKSNLKAMRHSFTEKRGYERIVFDFFYLNCGLKTWWEENSSKKLSRLH